MSPNPSKAAKDISARLSLGLEVVRKAPMMSGRMSTEPTRAPPLPMNCVNPEKAFQAGVSIRADDLAMISMGARGERLPAMAMETRSRLDAA